MDSMQQDLIGQSWLGISGRINLDIPGIGFRSFNNKNDMITALYLLGYKKWARELHKQVLK